MMIATLRARIAQFPDANEVAVSGVIIENVRLKIASSVLWLQPDRDSL
jgi:hypothetical protein